MEEVKILICGNEQKREIIDASENLKSYLNINLLIKDCSKSNHTQNIEYFFSLINDIQYFNAFILNYEKKEDILTFFKSFNTEDWGITNECYPFFLICEQIVSKPELKKYIENLNNSKEDNYKIRFGNLLFFNELEKKTEEFEEKILTIYNCYNQSAYKLKENNEETINILIIGVKNAGKTFLVNKLLWETRALSMENHYTTKLNVYKHKKYPINFYDISGFNNNEDEDILNLNSKIDEFNKDYKNIKNKIHAIFYVIDCNSTRILQNKEKEVIENIFKINIPIFIIGQKAKQTNIKNFIRKTKFELNTLSKDYKEKIEILKDRIFCLDSSKESLINLLKSVYDVFVLSKKANENIIISSSRLNNEELINRIYTDNDNITNINEEEKRIIKETFDFIEKSIFFNNFIEQINEVYNNILKIREEYITDNTYYFTNINVQEINDKIKKEFLKLFTEDDLNQINKLLNEQQKDLKEKGEDSKNHLKAIYGSSFFGIGISVLFSIINPISAAGLGLIALIDFIWMKYRNNKLKTEIDSNINNYYEKCKERFILINLLLIKGKAENYISCVDKFNNYIIEFENEDLL